MDKSFDEFDLFSDVLSAEEELCIHEYRQRINEKKTKLLNAFTDKSLKGRRLRYMNHNENRKVIHHITEFVPKNECTSIMKFIKSNDINWKTDRHSRYKTLDIALKAISNEAIKQKLFRIVQEAIELAEERNGFLRGDLGVLDAFIIKYAADNAEFKSLDMHTDGSMISFNVLLNESHEFQGGGTHFEASEMTVKTQQGDMVMHDSKLLHAGCPVTDGTRYLLVGFLDTIDAISSKMTRRRSAQGNP